MDVSPSWYKLKGYMEAQKAMMQLFSKQNSQVIKLVKQRNWLALQEQLRELEDISGRISVLEEKRHRNYLSILEEEGFEFNSSLGEILDQLPGEFAREMKALKNNLAIIAERIAIENKTLDSYVQAHNRTIRDIMGELLPETRGSLYSSNGRLRDNRLGTQSLLVNHSL